MKLDRTFAAEVKKTANGDGSREARFKFLATAKEAARELSTPEVAHIFDGAIQKYGRVVVGICVAVTIYDRRERLNSRPVCWACEVLKLWTNRPSDILGLAIIDNLHPIRIEGYAGSFIRLTTEAVEQVPTALVRANLPELCVAERTPNCRIAEERTGQLRFA